jgi:surfeit locus 1 family protein
MRWQRIVLASFFALPVLALLIGLGTWQLQRLHWKTALLAELAAAQAAPPVPATRDVTPFAHISATGRFRAGAEAFLGLEVRGSTLGGSLIAVLDRAEAPPLLVERGWAPFEGGAVQRPEGEVTVTGYARPSERRGVLAAEDDVARRRFLTFDTTRMAAALGAPDALPYALTVVAPGPARPAGGFGQTPAPMTGPLPDPARGFPAPRNPHLGYALTWYGLALAWVVVFTLWARKRIRDA